MAAGDGFTGIKLYINGAEFAGSGNGGAIGYTAARDLGILGSGTGGNLVNTDTECYASGLFPFALTDLQAKDLHTRLMREINNV